MTTSSPSPSLHISAPESGNAWILKFDSPLACDIYTQGAIPSLAGLSFAVKDNIDVEGHPTTAACPAFSRVASESATVVQKLLQAGALLVGKTNLDQFACGLNGTRSPYGEVPNAFNPDYVSGGSSSGSAYAVATGQVDFALGTDTAGSGRVPAGLNNIVGFKPTRGRISAHGVLPAAQSVDAVSILARTVPMAWRVLQSAAAPDPQDPFSRGPKELPWRNQPFPAAPRIGIPRQLEFFGDDLARAAFDQAMDRLSRMGAQLVLIDYGPLAQAAELLYGSALVAERYLAIQAFFDQHESDLVEPVRSIIGAGRRFSASDVLEAQLRLRELAVHVRPMWDDIDFMMVPTTPTHITREAMRQDPVALNRRLGYYTNFVNLLDYAALSVPSSIRPDGLPFGVTFIGQAGSDWCLAQWGARYHALADEDDPLPLGRTGERLNSADRTPVPALDATLHEADWIPLAVVGAHLSGMPLNHQLTDRRARLLRTTLTAPTYRLYALNGTQPPKPGLLRVAEGQGAGIEVEIWAVPVAQLGSLVAAIPSPLGIGRLMLADGGEVCGFVCEPFAVADAEDITRLGGWRAYAASMGQRSPASPSSCSIRSVASQPAAVANPL